MAAAVYLFEMFSGYLRFLGLKSDLKFLYDWRFYLAIAAAQFFYIALFMLTKSVLHLHGGIHFFLFQLYIAASEELLFRGFLLGILKERIGSHFFGISTANILTALVFSVFHLFGHPLLWAAGTFFPALIFGYFREKYNLLPAVLLHFIYNSEYFMIFR